MHVFPGEAYNYKVYFKVGEDPASPSLAAYTVTDLNGTIQSSTAITLIPGQTWAWVSVPGNLHTLTTEAFRQFRIETSYTVDGLVFKDYHVYYIVPDLYLSWNEDDARRYLHVPAADFTAGDLDFYRSYIELASGSIADKFIDALTGADTTMQFNARQLIFFHTLINAAPLIRLSLLKTVESETSKMTRMSNISDFGPIEENLKEQYALYYSLIRATGNLNTATFIVLDAPTDAITGV